jgi:DNA-binding CsgD family transcriptional regulator
MDQRPGLRVGQPCRCTRGRRLPGAVLPRAGVPAQAPADLRPARGVSPGASRDDPFLHHARRPRGAAAVLAQAHDILRQRPDLGVLPELAGQLQASLATSNTRAVGASSLTAAELRLLPLLSTHLSYAEIGERLYVSKNTVKTQAYSAYRKLGVSSRSEAVVRTRELGLDAL